jgi:RNA polymerase sigma-70 factor, ECF subfamily
MERLDDNTPTAAGHTGDAVSATLAASWSSGSAGASALELPSRPIAQLPDDALMALVAEGDPRAFAVLYERHARAALTLAMQMCVRRAIAEEVVQEAFLSFWRSRRHFDRSRGSVRTWVLGIVRNRAIDVLRQGVAHRTTEEGDRGLEELLQARELTDGEVGRRERSRELLVALDGLPPEQSCVITLAYYGGYTHTEIATMLDTPIGTVKGRMRLGLRKMAVSVPNAI